ncbi:MAG: hypothetical protein ABSB91_08330 [Sedimentisphaerales bacterium]
MNNEPTASRSDKGNDSATETAESLERSAKECSKIWMSQRLKGIAIGAGFGILGVVILVIVKLTGAGAKFFQESHNVASDTLHSVRGMPGVITGMIGIFVGFIGVVMILVQVVKVLLAPPRAGRTPNRTIQRFYKNALAEIDLPFFHGLGGIDVAAFACLLNGARQQVNGWPGFVKYWKEINSDLKSKLKSNSLNDPDARTTRKVKSVRIGADTEGRASYEVDIAFSVISKDSSSGKMKTLGPYVYTAKGEIVRIGNRWYLTSGKWNGCPVIDMTRLTELKRKYFKTL